MTAEERIRKLRQGLGLIATAEPPVIQAGMADADYDRECVLWFRRTALAALQTDDEGVARTVLADGVHGARETQQALSLGAALRAGREADRKG